MTSVGSIGIALKNSISSLQATQSALQTVSNNLANATNPDYTRKIVGLQSRTIDGMGAGVEIVGIRRIVDQFLIKEAQTNNSAEANFSKLDDFYSQMQSLFGTLNDDSSIARNITKLAVAVETLSLTPEGIAQQLNMANAASSVAQQLNYLSDSLQQLRLRADLEIADAITIVNDQMLIIDGLNIQIAHAKAIGGDTAEMEDKRDAAINTLSKEIEISTFTRNSGEIVIMTKDGKMLVDRSPQPLSHSPASSMNAQISYADGGITGITTLDGLDLTTSISSGRIAALIEMRDRVLPDLIAEFDRLAGTLHDAINAVHNSGSSYPPPQSLTGTKNFLNTDVVATTFNGTKISATGTVRIGVIDKAGAYANDGSGNPDYIDIDLAGLTLALGGTLTLDGVINAINNGTNVPGGFTGLDKATASRDANGHLVIRANDPSLGIAITSANVDGTFGTGTTANTGTITTGGGDITSVAATSAVMATRNISDAAGKELLTLLDTSGNLRLNVETTAGAPGIVRLAANSKLSFGAAGAVNTASASITAGGAVNVYIDSNADGTTDTLIGTVTFGAFTLNGGGTVGGAQGYLTVGGIDYSRNASIQLADSKLDFSTFFGLNDFFVTGRNYDTYASAIQGAKDVPLQMSGTLKVYGAGYGPVSIAYSPTDTLEKIAANITSSLGSQNVKAEIVTEGSNLRLRITDGDKNNVMLYDTGSLLSSLHIQPDNATAAERIAVRDSIALDPSLVSRGRIVTPATPAVGQSAIASGDNSAVLAMANKMSEGIRFFGAGNQPDIHRTIGDYAASILGFNSIQASSAGRESSFRQQLAQGLENRKGSVSGVNIDEEMSNMVLLQNAYSASARMITVTSELLETLIGMAGR